MLEACIKSLVYRIGMSLWTTKGKVTVIDIREIHVIFVLLLYWTPPPPPPQHMGKHKVKLEAEKNGQHFAGLNLKSTTAELCILKVAPLFHIGCKAGCQNCRHQCPGNGFSDCRREGEIYSRWEKKEVKNLVRVFLFSASTSWMTFPSSC